MNAISGTFPIPNDIPAFDAAWLTTVLQGRYPGLVIEKAVQTQVMRTACTKIFFTITTNAEGRKYNLPEKIVLKTGLEPHSRDMHKMLQVETSSYNELLPRTDVNRPKSYLAGTNGDKNYILILEDLTARGVKFLNLLETMDYDLCAAFLSRLARLHAGWWQAPEVNDPALFEWMPEPCTGRYLKKMDLLLSPESFNAFVTAPRGAATPRETHDAQRLRASLDRLRQFHLTMPRTVCHGDLHMNNLYRDADGTPAFLDWSPRKAPWFHDITYFMTAALDVRDRRKWERPLLSHYLRELRDLGIAAPSFDDAWFAYKSEVAWGMFIFLTNGFVFQTESSNTAAAYRFGVAMLDHDTFDLLGV